jgi:hypothetical protein
MKKLFYKLCIGGLVISCIFGVFHGCKSTKESKVKNKGETPIEVYCSGSEYWTDKDHFRANAVGESMDQNVSKDKALTEARSRLSASMKTLVNTVTDRFAISQGQDKKEELMQRYRTLTIEVIKQELIGTKIICEKVTKTSSGNYKTYIALELGGDELLSQYNNRVSTDEMLKIDYNYEKFKKIYDEEMNKLEKK